MSGINTCGEKHGEMCATVEELKRSDKDQWEVINILRDRYTKTLTTASLTLIVVIANLVILLVKK